MEFFDKHRKVVFLVGGIMTMSLGAAVVSYSNQLIPSSSSMTSGQTTVNGVSIATLKSIRTAGWITLSIGLILIGWYGYKVYGEYGIGERAKRFGERGAAAWGEFRRPSRPARPFPPPSSSSETGT